MLQQAKAILFVADPALGTDISSDLLSMGSPYQLTPLFRNRSSVSLLMRMQSPLRQLTGAWQYRPHPEETAGQHSHFEKACFFCNTKPEVSHRGQRGEGYSDKQQYNRIH